MKKIILSAVMTALLVSGCGGGGGGKKPEVEKPISFVKIYSNDFVKAVNNTTDGGYILASTSINEGLLVKKFDKNGNIQWEFKNEECDIRINSIDSVNDGYIVGGRGARYNGNSFGWDSIIVKLGNDGKEQWYKNIGGGGMRVFTPFHSPWMVA